MGQTKSVPTALQMKSRASAPQLGRPSRSSLPFVRAEGRAMECEARITGSHSVTMFYAGARLGRLQACKIVDGLRGLRRGGEDRLLVRLQDAKPIVEILRMIGPGGVGDAEIGAQESRPEFGDKFLHGVGLIAETLPELPVAAALDAGPVGQLVQLGRSVGLGGGAGRGADKDVGRGHVDVVGARHVAGAATAVNDSATAMGSTGFAGGSGRAGAA